MKLRIESDGTPEGTRVMDANTGDDIECVQSVEWKIGLDGLATAKIAVSNVEINAIAEKEKESE